ncbi:hypothetical protein ACFY36_01330 [Actinoplanes sp. NPDC000266]
MTSPHNAGSTATPQRPSGSVTKDGDRATAVSFDGRAISASSAGRFRECDQTKTRLENQLVDENGNPGPLRHLDVTAPWAGDRRTFPVRADDADSGAVLAQRLLAMPEFVAELTRAGDPIDSITLLTSGSQGREVQRALAEAGFPLRVYEPSTELSSDAGLVIPRGGHWVVHGGLTPTHEFAISYELIRAMQKDFPYAEGPQPRTGGPVPLDDRAETVRLLRAAKAEGLAGSGETLNLVAAQRALAPSEHPAVPWTGFLRSLRNDLGSVKSVVDLSLDQRTGRWRGIPGSVRRRYAATGRHRFEDGFGKRDADFNRTGMLLADDAVARPDRPEGLAVHLAEAAADARAQGLPVPVADTEVTGLRDDVADHLRTLGVDPGDVLPAMFDGELGDTPAAAVADDATPGTVVSVPLGGGVHTVLRSVLGEDSPPLRSAFDVAAHFLHDRTGVEVTYADVVQAAQVDSQVAGLLEVVALVHEAVAAAVDPEHVAVVTARLPISAILAETDPNLLTFLTGHQGLLREVLARHVTTPGDTPVWDTPVPADGMSTTAGDMLSRLLGPAAGPAGPATAAPGAEVMAQPVPGSWHLPRFELQLVGEARPELAETVAAAEGVAALLTVIDNMPEGPDRVDAVSRDRTDPAAAGDMRDMLDQIRTDHAALEGATRDASRGMFRWAVRLWLAPALAALPRGAVGDKSAQRVGEVLSMAGVASEPRTDWSAPKLADEFSGRWQQVMAESLFELPSGTVSLVQAQRTDDPEHVLLVQRTELGLTFVEAVGGRAGAETHPAADEAEALAVVDGDLWVLVGGDGRIIGLEPGVVAETDVRPAPVPVAPPAPTSHVVTGQGLVVVSVNAGADNLPEIIDYLDRDVPALPGFVVLEGMSSEDPQLAVFQAVARGFGLGTLVPAEPAPVARTGKHVISPSGWRVSGLDRDVRDDRRGALSWPELDDLRTGRQPPAGLTRNEAALVAEVNWRLKDFGPAATQEILDARKLQNPPLSEHKVSQLAMWVTDFLRNNGHVGRLPGGSARTDRTPLRPVPGSTAVRTANGVFVYARDTSSSASRTPGPDDETVVFAARMSRRPDAITIIGYAGEVDGRHGVLDSTGLVLPDQMVRGLVDTVLREGGDPSVLILDLFGSPVSAVELAQHAQRHLSAEELLGRPGPRAVVVRAPAALGPEVWQVVDRRTFELRSEPGLDQALAAARSDGPPAFDAIREVRARAAGHLAEPDVPSSEVFRAATESIQAERASAGRTVPAEAVGGYETVDELLIPVRPGATDVEMMDAARMWLRPGTFRENPVSGRESAVVSVRVNDGLQAWVLRLAPTGADPEMSASFINPVSTRNSRHRIWVNRRHSSADRSSDIVLTAVPLPEEADSSVLDELSMTSVARLTMEPGQLMSGRLIVEGEPFSAVGYARRLPFVGNDQRPVVVLTSTELTGSSHDRTFVLELARHAMVFVKTAGTGRWAQFDDGRQLDADADPEGRGIGWVLREKAGLEVAGFAHPLTMLDQGLDLDHDNAMLVRRLLAMAGPGDEAVLNGYLPLPQSLRHSSAAASWKSVYPAGLMPLYRTRPGGRPAIPISVPARFAGWVGGDSYPGAVDLTALVEAGAVKSYDGRMMFPVPSSAHLGIERVRRFLATSAEQGNAEDRAGQLFFMVTQATGVSPLTDWAADFGARFRTGAAGDLSLLMAGAATPVRAGERIFVAVGGDDPAEPILFHPDGSRASRNVMAGGIELLRDGRGGLAQVDLASPDRSVAFVRHSSPATERPAIATEGATAGRGRRRSGLTATELEEWTRPERSGEPRVDGAQPSKPEGGSTTGPAPDDDVRDAAPAQPLRRRVRRNRDLSGAAELEVQRTWAPLPTDDNALIARVLERLNRPPGAGPSPYTIVKTAEFYRAARGSHVPFPFEDLVDTVVTRFETGRTFRMLGGMDPDSGGTPQRAGESSKPRGARTPRRLPAVPAVPTLAGSPAGFAPPARSGTEPTDVQTVGAPLDFASYTVPPDARWEQARADGSLTAGSHFDERRFEFQERPFLERTTRVSIGGKEAERVFGALAAGLEQFHAGREILVEGRLLRLRAERVGPDGQPHRTVDVVGRGQPMDASHWWPDTDPSSYVRQWTRGGDLLAAHALPSQEAQPEERTVTVALTDIRRVLTGEMSALSDDSPAASLLRSADGFGHLIAGDFARDELGIDTQAVAATGLLDVQSYATVHGIASLWFLDAWANNRRRYTDVLVASVSSLTEVVRGLAQLEGQRDNPYLAARAGRWLASRDTAIRGTLARVLTEQLGRRATVLSSITATDDSVVHQSDHAPPLVELQFLTGARSAQPVTDDRRSELRMAYGAHASSLAWEVHSKAVGGEAERIVRTIAQNAATLADRLTHSFTVAGTVGEDRGEPFIETAESGSRLSARDLLAAVKPQLGDATRALVLTVAGDPATGDAFGRELQQLIGQELLERNGRLHGVVLGGTSQTEGVTSWRTVTAIGAIRPADDLSTALAAVFERDPALGSGLAELRARVAGFGFAKTLSNRALLEKIQASSLPGSNGDRAVRVPASVVWVPVTAGFGDITNVTRIWLKPWSIREVVSRAEARPSVPVRIGLGLRAEVLHVPGNLKLPETAASVVQPAVEANTRIWVNRYRVAGTGAEELVAVSLHRDIAAWKDLETLPPADLGRLIIEPGSFEGGLLDVGESELLDARQYADRLPNNGKDRPIVILQDRAGEMRGDRGRFVGQLSQVADVFVYRGEANRASWELVRNEKATHRGITPEDLFKLIRPELAGSPAVDLPTAFQSVVQGRVRAGDSAEAQAVRRALVGKSPNGGQLTNAYIRIPVGWPEPSLLDLLRAHPSGLMAFPLEPPAVNRSTHSLLRIRVPDQYSLRSTVEQVGYGVADLTALVDAGAHLAGGDVRIPLPATALRGLSQVHATLEALDFMRPVTAPGMTNETRIGLFFARLTGVMPGPDDFPMTAWAGRSGWPAQLRPVGDGALAGHLPHLDAGAVTPIYAGDDALLMVGTDDPARPTFLDPAQGGGPVEPNRVTEVSLLVDDAGRLVQYNLSDQQQPFVTAFGPGEDPSANSAPAVVDTLAVTAQSVDAVLRGRGQAVPASLVSMLSRAGTRATARRLSAAGRPATAIFEALADEVAAAPPVVPEQDVAVREARLRDGALESLGSRGARDANDARPTRDAVLKAIGTVQERNGGEWLSLPFIDDRAIRAFTDVVAGQLITDSAAVAGEPAPDRDRVWADTEARLLGFGFTGAEARAELGRSAAGAGSDQRATALFDAAIDRFTLMRPLDTPEVRPSGRPLPSIPEGAPAPTGSATSQIELQATVGNWFRAAGIEVTPQQIREAILLTLRQTPDLYTRHNPVELVVTAFLNDGIDDRWEGFADTRETSPFSHHVVQLDGRKGGRRTVDVFVLNNADDPGALADRSNALIARIGELRGQARLNPENILVLPRSGTGYPGHQGLLDAASGFHLVGPMSMGDPEVAVREGDNSVRSRIGWHVTMADGLQVNHWEATVVLDQAGIGKLFTSMATAAGLSVRGRIPGPDQIVYPRPQADPELETARAGADPSPRRYVRVVPERLDEDPRPPAQRSQTFVADFDVREFIFNGKPVTEVTQRLSLTDGGSPATDRVTNVFAALQVGVQAFNRQPANMLRNGSQLIMRVELAESKAAHWHASIVEDSADMDRYNLRAGASPLDLLHEVAHGLPLPDHVMKSGRPNLMGQFDSEAIDVPPLTASQLEAVSQNLFGLPGESDVRSGVGVTADSGGPMPESVVMMGDLLGVVQREGDLAGTLADNLAPDGLRLAPAEGADRTPAGAWIRKRISDPSLPGVRQIRSGADLDGLFRQSGDRGVVLLFGEKGQPEVYMRAGGEVWHFIADSSGTYRPEKWGGPGTFMDDQTSDNSPRHAIGLNSCGDFVG